MGHILTHEYGDLSMEARANAIREAYQQGRAAAAADRAAGGSGPAGVETPEARPLDYYAYVVEPLWSADECSDEEKEYFESGEAEADGDPRIDAFLRGWRESQRDYQADMASA